MEEKDFVRFHQAMRDMGGLFVSKLKDALDKKYPYAPGYKETAYQSGRNETYMGMAPKVDTGTLRDTIHYEYDENEEKLTLMFQSYWQNVNYGRTAGFYVPIKPLKEWAMRKLGLDDKEATGMAFAVSKNIYKFGIAPTNFYDDATEEMIQMIEEAGAEALAVDVETFFERVFEDIIPKNNI